MEEEKEDKEKEKQGVRGKPEEENSSHIFFNECIISFPCQCQSAKYINRNGAFRLY